jgi:hypothetical protein
MGSTGKSIRDGGIAGGTAVFVSTILVKHVGIEPGVAWMLGPVAGAVASRIYRVVRARWPWLLEADPPARTEQGYAPPSAPTPEAPRP